LGRPGESKNNQRPKSSEALKQRNKNALKKEVSGASSNHKKLTTNQKKKKKKDTRKKKKRQLGAKLTKCR